MGEVIYLFGKPDAPARPEDVLKACTPVLVWFPFFGRNAWQSTWVKRYQSGSLQPSRQDAESYIEARLKQGSNWGFQVLPAFHLQFTNAAYLLCEINTDSPFRNLLDSSLLRPGTPKSRCIEGLSPASQFWASGQKQQNGVILQETELGAHSFRPYAERTVDPRRIWTIGTYKRGKVDLGGWGFGLVSTTTDVRFFETALKQIENAPEPIH